MLLADICSLALLGFELHSELTGDVTVCLGIISRHCSPPAQLQGTILPGPYLGYLMGSCYEGSGLGTIK